MNAHDRKDQRRARLFRNGRSQAVRIPKEWEFAGDEVVIDREEDGTLSIHPQRPRKGLLALLAELEPVGDDEAMPEIEDYPPEPVDLGWLDRK